MAAIELRHLSKFYGNQIAAVLDANLEIHDGEFMILLGPSGCGKSTTLRMIAGLESVSEGEVHIGGRLVNELAPRDRNIAVVFQSYALYPHMTVAENVDYVYPKTDKRRPFVLSMQGAGPDVFWFNIVGQHGAVSASMPAAADYFARFFGQLLALGC